MECLFCKIVAGEIPSTKVYEDDRILVFKDIKPCAPVHNIIIPKEHTLSCANDINDENAEIIAYIFSKIPHIAKLSGLEEGYRIVNNCGKNGAQTVMHLHFHLIGGTELSEKLN